MFDLLNINNKLFILTVITIQLNTFYNTLIYNYILFIFRIKFVYNIIYIHLLQVNHQFHL